ncbi:hypothetical protein GCM10010349_50300 [Streptomyces flavofungini]|nr:hypothetical protein GCM10010349_50300 [Streptomyces flavofungini]
MVRQPTARGSELTSHYGARATAVRCTSGGGPGAPLGADEALRPIHPCLNLKVKKCSQGFRFPQDRSTKESTARETKDIREDYL